ncbi:hypothetical protein [Actinoplanes sp. NBRC 103695]|uniref:hypothetical protein n=1 Tax=Actinoplanes sp. NBRC 103695 TaxID=3032202 RepID=UPI0024A23F45|nr:hypothetical protein [Actinoplanes sp. NBRC 103695]GLY97136.1 hypothetical protein Acsp02_43900 [Actinoplanes sp. NBRC 103695]
MENNGTPWSDPTAQPGGSPYSGQPYSGPPSPGQPLPGQPFSGQPFAGPPPGQPGWPGYGAPPPAPPAKKSKAKWIIALVAVVGVLAVGCFGAVAFGVVKAARNAESKSKAGSSTSEGYAPPGEQPFLTEPSSAPPTTNPPQTPVGVTGSVPAGSKASSTKVKKSEDFERVCDRWYFPKQPKYSTALSPHPIAISVRDRKDLPYRTNKGYVGIPYDAPPAIKNAWEPKDPTKVQLVACVDLVTTDTAKVKTCPIDKPKPSKITMKEGRYRLQVYEAATRRKIFDTKLTGENETCPLFIFIGNDRNVYSALEDRQLTEALERFVEQ